MRFISMLRLFYALRLLGAGVERIKILHLVDNFLRCFFLGGVQVSLLEAVL